MLNLHLYDMAKVREQEFIAEAARHQASREGHGGLIAAVAKRLRRSSDRSQH